MLEAIVLGLIQGLTEFLPVSSSGHLVIVPYLLSWEQPPLAFSVALHAGTLLALLVYFAGDLTYLATRAAGMKITEDGEAARARRTIALLAVASVPAAAAGLALQSTVEDLNEQPQIVAGFLFVTAAMLFTAETIRRRRAADLLGLSSGRDSRVPVEVDPGRDESTVGFLDAIVIGCSQALALIPGISRAGATMSTGMLRGLSREGAARFSFLMAIPIILGAFGTQLGDISGGIDGRFGAPEVVAGVVTAAVSGYWAIRFLLKLVARDSLNGFARYVALLGALTLVGYIWIGPPSTIS